MNEEQEFLIKVVRNGLLLSGMYFFSVWATGDLSWELCKPVILFMGTYICTELMKRYKIDAPNAKPKTLFL